jgi:IS5 family transposase
VTSQKTFSQSEFEQKKKLTRRERFLGEMDAVVPWALIIALIKPFYPKGERGRPPIGLERMLRIYFLQLWYTLADEALEDALYDSQAMQRFAGINLCSEDVPDATTLLKFRRLLESHDLQKAILDKVNEHLSEHHLLMREGTIVDATIIEAPTSTKNRAKERDPAMHQAKKGNEWHFGMKAHIGSDAESGIVHTVIGTAANVADVACAGQALHGEEKVAYVDAGYTGVEKRPEIIAEHGEVIWVTAAKRGKVKALPEGEIKELTQKLERMKAQVRAKVEHPFHVIKDLFGFRKVRYRGLEKNTGLLRVLFALANLLTAAPRLREP